MISDAEKIQRLRILVQSFITHSDKLHNDATQLLGSPNAMWGSINDLNILVSVAEQALEGNWDYDPYEGCPL